VIVGDRIFTDIVLANRMSRTWAVQSSSTAVDDEKLAFASEAEETRLRKARAARIGPLSVWTTGVWKKESMTMRYLEKSLVQNIQRFIVPDNGLGHTDVSRFMKPPPSPPPPLQIQKKGLLSRIQSMLSRNRW
jgi:phosphatidylglycerophosphatase GEP4